MPCKICLVSLDDSFIYVTAICKLGKAKMNIFDQGMQDFIFYSVIKFTRMGFIVETDM